MKLEEEEEEEEDGAKKEEEERKKNENRKEEKERKEDEEKKAEEDSSRSNPSTKFQEISSPPRGLRYQMRQRINILHNYKPHSPERNTPLGPKNLSSKALKAEQEASVRSPLAEEARAGFDETWQKLTLSISRLDVTATPVRGRGT
ncbi:hypothetical protein KM043_014629 [Ampulex compressa]|nr:hypothetical protein KM043_014629 [Ampulex compressa]